MRLARPPSASTAERRTAAGSWERDSRAPSVGVGVGLVFFGMSSLAQVGLAIAQLPDVSSALIWVVVPLVLLAVVLVPVAPPFWPISPRRGLVVGLVWLTVGLASPLWVFGFWALIGALFAAPAALCGAVVGWRSQRRSEEPSSATASAG